MDKSAIESWATLLDSGELTQIQAPMHTSDGFCPFGVLIEAYRRKFGGEWVEAKYWCPELAHLFTPKLEFLGNAYLPPEQVLKWMALICKCPRVKDNIHLPTCEALKIINVIEAGGSFKEIAARLRKL